MLFVDGAGEVCRSHPSPLLRPPAMTTPASQCRRAFQRQIIPGRDAVWITEGLLSSTFERFCRVSRTWNRRASNVPGPLESQRRLGRRRMGDASTWHCPPTPPSWEFTVPLNLSQWTWKPPSAARSAEHHQSHQDLDSHPGLLALLDGWLQGSVSREAGELRTASATATLPDSSSPSAADTRASRPFTADLDAFRWAAAHADDKAFASHSNNICRQLRQRIILGEVSPEDLLSVSVEIWDTLRSRLQGSPLGHRLSLSFCRAILSGLTNSKVFPPDILDVRFWGALLTEMSKLPADDTLCNLLVKTMAAVPAILRSNVSEGVLCVLGRFFSAWGCSRHAPNNFEIKRLLDVGRLGIYADNPKKLSALPTHLRQARALSEALHLFTPEGTDGFLSAAHRLALSTKADLPKGRRALRYSWLYVLAQMPNVNQDFLFDAAAGLSARSLQITKPLTCVEVCSLLLTQWASRDYLPLKYTVYKSYRSHCTSDRAALASLFLAIFNHLTPGTAPPLLRSVWRFLTKLGRKDEVLGSLNFKAARHSGRRQQIPVRMLEDLAWTSDDHNIAIALRDLWRYKINLEDRQPQFYPGVFEKYLEDIVNDPDLPRTSLNYKLRRHRGTFGVRRASVAERVSAAFAGTRHLTRRSAFRHVSQGLYFTRAIKGKVPTPVLMIIYRLVTQDLWQKRPGTTKRLLWWLSLVEKEFGVDVAWACRLQLRRWRKRLVQQWLGKNFIRRD
ncbi:uncharacterized protein B0T15DRAFT_517240 [Chaetomium strumarium]|uniref:Uncharacterized protein n=1 Tax=Chaetomium strumarium TaxID=1170767 RepID=A0AAJ0H1H7_9PEZI|nr:hypothetical protein B0T15DRAFT_517240 [Chaetomium strumarium]